MRERETAPDAAPLPGWPRSWYRQPDRTYIPEPDEHPQWNFAGTTSQRRRPPGAPLYTQWIAVDAEQQIMACEPRRIDHVNVHFACSSCAQVMRYGYVFDWNAMHGRDGARYGIDDSAYGSPLCGRCLVFATRHCPWFATLEERHGAEAEMFVRCTGAHDYGRIAPNDTGAIELTAAGRRKKRVSLTWVRARVASGELDLTDVNAATDLGFADA